MNRRIRPVVAGLLLALGVLPACAARSFRDAQTAFNEAAAAEQRQYAAVLEGRSALTVASSAAAGYRLSLSRIERELAGHRRDLEREQLLGTALMLKALCRWRLADLEDRESSDGSLADALADIQGSKVTLGTRDQVLVEALPGLRDHDLGLRATDYEDAARFFRSALNTTDRALDRVDPPPNHPVRLYIRLAQLSTCRAWHAAAYAFLADAGPRRRTESGLAKGRFREIVEKLRPGWEADQQLRDTIRSLSVAMGITFPPE